MQLHHRSTGGARDGSDVKAFGAWSKDSQNRSESTSGGIAFEIAKQSIESSDKVCAVRYNYCENIAEHAIFTDIESLKDSKGTKYLSSRTLPAFQQLKRNEKYTVFGLPCQIDSLRRYIKKYRIEQNFLLIDLFCYGVPSLLAWREYLDYIHRTTGAIHSVKFRSKKYGWHQSACLEINGKNSNIEQRARDCMFYGLFFSDSCLNKCCYKQCKYKLLSSAADIRLGDFWGSKYQSDDRGVNVVLTFSKSGEKMIQKLNKSCCIESVSIEEALENQKSSNAVLTPIIRFITLLGLRTHLPLKMLFIFSKYGRYVLHPVQLIQKLKSKI